MLNFLMVLKMMDILIKQTNGRGLTLPKHNAFEIDTAKLFDDLKIKFKFNYNEVLL
jgi:hypothetical protein